MKYEIGIMQNPKIKAVGKYIVLKSRDEIEEELKKIYEELSNLKSQNEINDLIEVYDKLVVNEEIGYKEEDIEMFLGYFINANCYEKYKSYYDELCNNKGYTIWDGKENEVLAVRGATDKSDISNIYSNIIEFACNNGLKVFGAFHEKYYQNVFDIYI